MAVTEWLLFTDADVFFAPDYFAQLRRCPPADVLYGRKLSLTEFAAYYRWFGRGQQLAHWPGIPAVQHRPVLHRLLLARICSFGGPYLRILVVLTCL